MLAFKLLSVFSCAMAGIGVACAQSQDITNDSRPSRETNFGVAQQRRFALYRLGSLLRARNCRRLRDAGDGALAGALANGGSQFRVGCKVTTRYLLRHGPSRFRGTSKLHLGPLSPCVPRSRRKQSSCLLRCRSNVRPIAQAPLTLPRPLLFTAYMRASAAPIIAWTAAFSGGHVARPTLALALSSRALLIRNLVLVSS